MGEFIASNGRGFTNLISGSFSDLIKAVLSTKSSIFLYKSGNNKALLDKKSLTTNSKTVHNGQYCQSLHCNIPPDQIVKTFS